MSTNETRQSGLPREGFKKLLLGVFIVGFCLFASGVPAQELYRWVDEKGSIHFTDNFYSIPEKYRDKVERRRFPSPREPSTDPPQPQPGQPRPAFQPQRFVVPFTRAGNAIIVKGVVNGKGTVEFILDTGASLTIIPRSHAEKVGINPERGDPILVSGVGGTVVVSQVQIDSLELNGAEVRNLAVAIHPGFINRGLLGMDFLSEFRIDINYAQNYVTLEYQPGPHEGRSPLWWQQKFRFWHSRRKNFEYIRSVAKSRNGREMAEKLLRAVEKRINDLETRASRAGVPREFRR